VRCLECGAETAEAGPFCGRCGAPTGMPAADSVPPAGRAVWRRAGIIAVAACVAVACLVTALTVISGRPGASSRPRASDAPAVPATPSATVRWINGTGYGNDPAAAGGTVYAGSDDGTMYALDAATGRLRWARTTEAGAGSSLAAAGGTVYAGGDDGTVYALDAGP
jgi:outer membrane protein assembly factor BamB